MLVESQLYLEMGNARKPPSILLEVLSQTNDRNPSPKPQTNV
jgi:hypothetical protein